MKVSRRRLLTISAVLMLLTAAAHTVGFVLPPSDPGIAGVEKYMGSSHFDAGLGMNPSMLDTYMLLALAMSITFTAFGILNLYLAAARDLPARLLNLTIRANTLWVAAFIALAAFYRMPPPLIMGVIIALPLIAALLAKDTEATPTGSTK